MLADFFKWLEQTTPARTISESGWLFPTIETLHVLALTLLIGSIAMVDLRLINVALRKRDVAELSDEVLPWTWCAFVVAALTGFSLFASAATKYAANVAMQIKFVLLMLAAINMLTFNLTLHRSIKTWGRDPKTPLGAQIAGGLSLILWIGVMVSGRWIGFL